MKKTAEVKEAKKKSSWIWWIVFPPYAMYRFVRYSAVKWYFKVPLVLILAFTLILAIDLSLAPDRVEEAKAETAITKYLQNESSEESVRKVERMGEGINLLKEKEQRLVYYRAVTSNGLFHFGLTSDKEKALTVQQVEQLFPIRMSLTKTEALLTSEIALWLAENEEKVGKVKERIDSNDSERTQTIKTDKGTYILHYGNQSVYKVNRIDKNEVVLDEENKPNLPEEIIQHVEENSDKYGTSIQALAYEMDVEKEKYFFKTTKGDFIAEVYDDGTVKSKIRNNENK